MVQCSGFPRQLLGVSPIARGMWVHPLRCRAESGHVLKFIDHDRAGPALRDSRLPVEARRGRLRMFLLRDEPLDSYAGTFEGYRRTLALLCGSCAA